MRKLSLFTLLAAIACFSATPALARTEAFVSTGVNLRAGPGTEFPIITSVQKSETVTILGCLQGSGWCEVESKGERGWMSGRYVKLGANRQTLQNNGAVAGVPHISFDRATYWRDHYQNKSFYRE